jgi:hemerythrin superfamily protein
MIMAKKSKQSDILSLIEADHRKVDSLFAQMETANTEQMYTCFNEIYKEFTLHVEAEQMVFYPAMQEFEETQEFIEEAEEEHEDARVLLEEMKAIGPADPEFKSKLMELKESIQHHVQEEESEIFEAVRSCMEPEMLMDLAQEFMDVKQKFEADVEAAMVE